MAKKLTNLVKNPADPVPVLTKLDDLKILVKLPASKINKDLDPYWKTEIFTKTTSLTNFVGNTSNINGPSAAAFSAELEKLKKLLDWKTMKEQLIVAKQMDFNIRLSGLGKTAEGDKKNANSLKAVTQMATVIKCMSVMFSRCTATISNMNTNIDALNGAYSNINGNIFHKGDRQRKRGYINRYSYFAGQVREHLLPAASYHIAAIDDLIVKMYNDLAASGNAAIAGLNANHAKAIKKINAKHLKEMKAQQDKHKLEMQNMIAGYEEVIGNLKNALAKSQALNKKYEASLNKAISILDKYDKAAAGEATIDNLELKNSSLEIDIDVAKIDTKHATVSKDNASFVEKQKNPIMVAGGVAVLAIIALFSKGSSSSNTSNGNNNNNIANINNTNGKGKNNAAN